MKVEEDCSMTADLGEERVPRKQDTAQERKS